MSHGGGPGPSGGGGNGRGGGGGGGGADAGDAGGEAGDAGDAPAAPSGNLLTIPLSPIEILIRNHALLCSIGFLILLPLGVLLARYARTFTRRWFWGHATAQLIISGPVIFTGWAMGYHAANTLELQFLHDPHQKIGITLLALYALQILLGAFIHFARIPLPGSLRGHRTPQNYLHAVLGLAILALAAYQVHYGLTIEWNFATGGLHQIPNDALQAWMALIIVFWVLYFLGLALLPRQYSKEKTAREEMLAREKAGETPAGV